MYQINTSFIVSPNAHDRWLTFFTEKVVPHVRSQDFEITAFSRVLHDTAEDHYTYSLLVSVQEMPDFIRYKSEIVEQYAALAAPLFGEGVLHFVTLMKKINI